MINNKIIDFSKYKSTISSIIQNGKSIVLAGGCFDILHIGHIKFLEESKKNAKTLIILLESDKRVKKLKGEKHPYFPQYERALVLQALQIVDLIFLLPDHMTDSDYDNIISEIKPCLIAVTLNDPLIGKKKIQAEKIGAKLMVVPFLKTYSSSAIAGILGID